MAESACAMKKTIALSVFGVCLLLPTCLSKGCSLTHQALITANGTRIYQDKLCKDSNVGGMNRKNLSEINDLLHKACTDPDMSTEGLSLEEKKLVKGVAKVCRKARKVGRRRRDTRPGGPSHRRMRSTDMEQYVTDYCAYWDSEVGEDGARMCMATLTAPASFCPPPQRCIPSKYAPYDGWCSNPSDDTQCTTWTGTLRLLPPTYSPNTVDGIETTPDARYVSNKLCYSVEDEECDVNEFWTVFGQFLSHDTSLSFFRADPATGRTVRCCDPNGKPWSSKLADCMYANITGDPYYSSYNWECLGIPRLTLTPPSDCSFGSLTPITAVSPSPDLSTVYGSSENDNRNLRAFQCGRLKVETYNGGEFPPQVASPATGCRLVHEEDKCFETGDLRSNQHPALTVQHTIWIRYHNLCADKMCRVNPHWDDEKVFQECRRIAIAVYRHIIYHEYLPPTIGKSAAEVSGFSHHPLRTLFDDEVPCGITTEFAVATFRVFHSAVAERIRMSSTSYCPFGEQEDLEEFMNSGSNPQDYDNILLGTLSYRAKKVDPHIISILKDSLFNVAATNFSAARPGVDLMMIDIMRQYDVGLPPYSDYAELCGHPPIKQWEDLADVFSSEMLLQLQEVYEKPCDIPPAIGIISEKHLDGAQLGPTGSCIVVDQFLRLKYGNSYHHTHINSPYPFTDEQVMEIENITMSSVLCDTTPNLLSVQQNPFNVLHAENQLQCCENLHSLDLTAWKEEF